MIMLKLDLKLSTNQYGNNISIYEAKHNMEKDSKS